MARRQPFPGSGGHGVAFAADGNHVRAMKQLASVTEVPIAIQVDIDHIVVVLFGSLNGRQADHEGVRRVVEFHGAGVPDTTRAVGRSLGTRRGLVVVPKRMVTIGIEAQRDHGALAARREKRRTERRFPRKTCGAVESGSIDDDVRVEVLRRGADYARDFLRMQDDAVHPDVAERTTQVIRSRERAEC